MNDNQIHDEQIDTKEPSPRDMMRWIAWAVWAWGGALALGAYLMYEVNGVRTYDIRRPLVILAAVGVFQLIWWAVSVAANRKLAARQIDRHDAGDVDDSRKGAWNPQDRE